MVGQTAQPIPKGYKLTEVGVIPNDWEVMKLGEIAHVATGNTPPTRDNSNYGEEFLFVSPADLGNGKYINDTQKKLSKKGFNISRKFPANSILFTCIGSTIGKIGVASIELTSNQQINAVIPYDSYSSNCLFYILSLLASQIQSLAGEQAVPIVNKTDFEETLIPLPPTKIEQTAIATVLCDTDALIENLEILIAKKRVLKQGAMQELLTGKRRLPGFVGKWRKKSLGEIGSFKKGRGIRKDSLLTDGLPCIRYGEIYTYYNDYIKELVSYISVDTAKESQRIYKGDLLFAGSGETAEEIGKCVAYLGDKEAYAGGDIIILTPDGFDSKFLGYLMNQKSVVTQKSQLGQGDAVVHIYASALAGLSISVPPTKTEQTAIAGSLSYMDSEIKALEQKQLKYQQIKQGMMQVLLAGKVRLV